MQFNAYFLSLPSLVLVYICSFDSPLIKGGKMTKDILKYSAKAVLFLVGTIFFIALAILVGIALYLNLTGEIGAEKLAVFDEINEKIIDGQYPLEELTENNISISFSKDEVNNLYNLELTNGNTGENIYLDDEANIINIEKYNNNSLSIVMGFVTFVCCLISVFYWGSFFIKNVCHLIDEIKWYKDMKKKMKEEGQDTEE